MLRTFTEHTIRRTQSLDGWWEFAPQKNRPEKYPRSIHVPSAWEQLPGLESYRGQGWYRTRIQARPGCAVRLVFEGVSHTGTVFVDGRKVGRHYDAFTPWDVVVPGLSAGEHELVVGVDNTFGPHSALHIENDYYTYGGITRPVEVQWVPEVFIERLAATPRRERNRWLLDVRARLRNWSRQTQARRVRVDDAETGSLRIPGNGVREVALTIAPKNVKAWTAETPVLYPVKAALLDGGAVVDDLIDRVGFREVAVRGAKLLLNGRPLKLRGYNRHEDHPQFGNALPVAAMVTDLEIMRDLGCNFVRTSHYPNDRRFLDLCDEMGFYVWEESHARNVSFEHPKYRKQMTDSTTEMVEWHRNHPAIIIWGCLNECDSVTTAGAREHARVLRLLKRLDASRPVTFASNKGDTDRCLGLVDIVSWNRYSGWYNGGIDEIGPRFRKLLRWLDSPKSRGGKGKPIILSEFGADGIYGFRHPHRGKGTEEFQADLLDESLRVYLNHPRIVGTAIWQFCDVRITPAWGTRRAKGMNVKGTVDEYRRPKLAYDVVKRRMRAAKL